MYNIYVVFKCLPGKREEFVKRVKDEGILDKIRAEDGFIRYDYYYSAEDECELLLIETWQSYEHQQTHIKTAHMDALRSFKGDYITSTTIGEFDFKG
jgi:quinol monooxygenase YgiN